MPYFSIIIPTYNSSKTIRECLDSVLSQTFVDFELLIMDGVSTDNTLQIIREYSDHRILINSEPDRGIYDAMNKGIQISKGGWLYFLGSDDLLYDDSVLHDIYKKVDKTNLDVIYGNVLMMMSGVLNDGEFDYNKIQTDPICHQAIFYKKTIFKELGTYNLRYRISADIDFNLKWFFSTKHKYLYTEKIIAKYAETGFSSSVTDEIFYNDLPGKLIKLGWRSVDILKLKELAQYASINNNRKNNIIKSMVFKSLYYLLRGVDLLNRKVLKKK